MKRWIAIAASVVVLVGGLAVYSWAVVTANSVITAQSLGTAHLQNFVQGTDAAGTFKTLYTAGANGSKCNGILVSTNDGTATHGIVIEIVNSAVNYPLSYYVTTLAPTNNTTYVGSNATSATNFPGLPVDSDGNPYIQMISGDVLKATFLTALTASDQILMHATCADF